MIHKPTYVHTFVYSCTCEHISINKLMNIIIISMFAVVMENILLVLSKLVTLLIGKRIMLSIEGS